jgi:galactokinase
MQLLFEKPMRETLFSQIFNAPPEILSSAPGRINIIGEHTDYNNGYVLPAAIHLRDHFLASRRPDKTVRVWAEDFNQGEDFPLAEIAPSGQNRWVNYVKGIFWVLRQNGYRLGGVNALVGGEVPLEAGLSSSAALEVSVIKGLDALFGLGLEPITMARLAQKAENDFVGVKCGLMDQFIAVFGRRDSALFLDCETLDFELFPLNLGKQGLGIMVYDTRVLRRLASSEYNKRRHEAAGALEVLKNHKIASYKEADLALLEAARAGMSEVQFRRARHVITENNRVRRAVEALKTDDFAALGSLLFSSHESLRDDYEVSCPELDLLYSIGREFSGCLGARLVGAGFGGSGIALLNKSKIADFKRMMQAEAAGKGFPEPRFYEVSIGYGAKASSPADGE